MSIENVVSSLKIDRSVNGLLTSGNTILNLCACASGWMRLFIIKLRRPFPFTFLFRIGFGWRSFCFRFLQSFKIYNLNSDFTFTVVGWQSQREVSFSAAFFVLFRFHDKCTPKTKKMKNRPDQWRTAYTFTYVTYANIEEWTSKEGKHLLVAYWNERVERYNSRRNCIFLVF